MAWAVLGGVAQVSIPEPDPPPKADDAVKQTRWYGMGCA